MILMMRAGIINIDIERYGARFPALSRSACSAAFSDI